MKRKILTAILATVCALCCLFGLASCKFQGYNQNNHDNKKPSDGQYVDPPKVQDNDFTLELNVEQNTYTVIGITNEEKTDFIVPDEYDGKLITAIGKEAFTGNENLKSIKLSKNIVSIGESAFAGCNALVSISLPESVTTLGGSAFNGCKGLLAAILSQSLESIPIRCFEGCTTLNKIDIPNSVTSIGDSAFRNCSGLKTVIIGNGISEIGKSAFERCSKLDDITIAEGVKVIRENAFQNCSSLKNIVIPDSVTSIGSSAFYNCEAIENMTLPFIGSGEIIVEKTDIEEKDDEEEEEKPQPNTNFGYIFGAMTSESNSMVPLSLKTVTITGDKDVPEHAFTNVGKYTDSAGTTGIGLETLIFTGNVKVFRTGAFQFCMNLHNVVIPASLTLIQRGVFGANLVNKIYYMGDATQFDRITIREDNYNIKGNGEIPAAARYYYSAGAPASPGNYWHFDDNKQPAIWS